MKNDIGSLLLDSRAAVKLVWVALESLCDGTGENGVADMQAVLHRALGEMDKARDMLETQERAALPALVVVLPLAA